MNNLATRNILKWIFTFLIAMILIGCSSENNDNNFLNSSLNGEQSKEESIENNDNVENLVDLNQEKIKKLEQIEKKKEAEKAKKEKEKKEAEKAEEEKQKREAEKAEEEKKKKEAKKAKTEKKKKEAKKTEKEKQKKEVEKTKKEKKEDDASSKEKAPSKPKPKSNNSFANRVIDLTNAERKKAGLNPLKKHHQLMKSAQAYSVDMYERGVMDHNGSKKYGDFPGVINAYVSSYRSIAENIAQGHPTPEAVVTGWMNSPGHRGNILNPNFTHIGVGYVSPEHYWTQHFLAE